MTTWGGAEILNLASKSKQGWSQSKKVSGNGRTKRWVEHSADAIKNCCIVRGTVKGELLQ